MAINGDKDPMSAQLAALQGRISDEDYESWADIEQRILLNRALLVKLDAPVRYVFDNES